MRKSKFVLGIKYRSSETKNHILLLNFCQGFHNTFDILEMIDYLQLNWFFSVIHVSDRAMMSNLCLIDVVNSSKFQEFYSANIYLYALD